MSSQGTPAPAGFGARFGATVGYYVPSALVMLGLLVLSAILGVVLAVIIVWNDLLMRTIMPVLVLFNTLPKIALAPLFVI